MNREDFIYKNRGLIQKISTRLIECTPEHWNSFKVVARVISPRNSLEDVEIAISSNEDFDDICSPTDELNSSIFNLLDEFKTEFQIRKFECEVSMNNEGKWSHSTKIEFFDP